MMRLNRHRKLLIFFIIFVVIIGWVCLLYCSNRSRGLNVLLITIDCLSANHLGCYGYGINTSPNIDKLAKEGILFKETISQATWTSPSIHSLITSTYVSTHGAYFWDQSLPDSFPTLPQILRQNKYCTILISGHGSFPPLYRSFDIFEDIPSGTADKITQKAIFWLKINQKKMFFLWIHYMDAHNSRLDISKEQDLTKEGAVIYTRKYNEAIMYIDSRIEVLLKKLKELGLLKNTIIIITADHGQKIDENGSFSVYDKHLRDFRIKVPLIIFHPKLYNKSKIIKQQVQHIDIIPTIFDILKVKRLKIFEGISFLPLIKGKDVYSRFAFSEHKVNKDYLSTGDWIYTQFAIRSPDYKLIYTSSPYSKVYELYNLKTDPQELNNLIGSEKNQFEFLKANLEKWMDRPKQNITLNPLKKPIDKDTEEKLKSLGYIQ